MEMLEKILAGEIKTSATIVPENLQQTLVTSGFTPTSKKKVLLIVGEPRKYSLTYDYVYTASQFFLAEDYEVAVRDLYDLKFNPVLSAEEFYYVKDGLGIAPPALLVEQDYIKQADIVIFIYPNWHDTPTAIVKGYMEKVFAKGFAYTDSNHGPIGLLTGKKMYTIMNCGYLGGGMGYVGDGIGIDNQRWDMYMNAFKVLDDDTAAFWGMENTGRFVSDQHPKNFSPDYEEKLQTLRETFRQHLKRDLLNL